MANKIQIKRGLKTKLPILDAGELAFTTDTKEVFIGDNSINYQLPTKDYVDNILKTNDAMIFKGTIGTSGTVTSLPTTHDIGWTYKVITDNTYVGKVCEIGDMLISLVSRSGSGNQDADWAVIQANIDGAVTGPSSSTDNTIAIFNGVSGKVIKDSSTLVSSLATSTHVHGNITNDGKIGTTQNLVVVTTTSGSLTTRTAGSSGQFLAHDSNWATPPDTATASDNILKGSNSGTQITYAAYTDNQGAAVTPKFYTHATNPSGTSRLNVSSYFYATQLYDDAKRVLNVDSTVDGGSFPT